MGAHHWPPDPPCDDAVICRGCCERREREAVNAEREKHVSTEVSLRAEIVMLRGTFCGQKIDRGSGEETTGPCGVCLKCLRSELNSILAERDGLQSMLTQQIRALKDMELERDNALTLSNENLRAEGYALAEHNARMAERERCLYACYRESMFSNQSIDSVREFIESGAPMPWGG